MLIIVNYKVLHVLDIYNAESNSLIASCDNIYQFCKAHIILHDAPTDVRRRVCFYTLYVESRYNCFSK